MYLSDEELTAFIDKIRNVWIIIGDDQQCDLAMLRKQVQELVSHIVSLTEQELEHQEYHRDDNEV